MSGILTLEFLFLLSERANESSNIGQTSSNFVSANATGKMSLRALVSSDPSYTQSRWRPSPEIPALLGADPGLGVAEESRRLLAPLVLLGRPLLPRLAAENFRVAIANGILGERER